MSTPYLKFYIIELSHEETLESIDPGELLSEQEWEKEGSYEPSKMISYDQYVKRHQLRLEQYEEAKQDPNYKTIHARKIAMSGDETADQVVIAETEALPGFRRWVP